MSALPDPSDPSGMLSAVADLPGRMEQAWREVRDLLLPEECREPRAVVVAGMGGSAVGGDLAAVLTADSLRRPVAVVRDYSVPAWVDHRTLCIASSFSGNTEETLAAYASARERGARLVAITSGGALAEIARRDGAPVVSLPPGGTPRAALGASLSSILGVLRAAGVVADPGPALEEAASAMREVVRECGPGAQDGGRAGALARKLARKVVLVYAPEPIAPVARRWKTQLNENAKTFADWDVLPELDHNSIVGYAHPVDLGSRSHVVILEAPAMGDRTAARIAATRSLLVASGYECTVVRSEEGHPLAQGLSLVQMGDLVSVYVAYLHGVDPTPVPAIDALKAALAGRAESR